MAASVEKIKELLGNGLTNEVVATAVGVTPSYISQLMADESFYNEVVSLRTTALAAASNRDRSWDGIEDKLLTKLDEVVTSGMIYKPTDLLRALAVVNNAKRRGNPVQHNFASNNQVVVLNMPTQVVNTFKMNALKEVVEVAHGEDTQTLISMPASSLMKQLAESHKDQKYAEIQKHLPGGSVPQISDL